MPIIENAVERLANGLRLHAENIYRTKKLFLVDKEEAVNNLDRSFDMILECFHTVYDVTKDKIDYFEYGDTAIVIFLRNAIHHRDHALFKSWNSEMHLEGGIDRKLGAEFLMVSYNGSNGGKFLSECYYKIYDFYFRLENHEIPGFSFRKRMSHRSIFERDLFFGKICEKAKTSRYPSDQVYINVMPIVCSAASRIFSILFKERPTLKGVDSRVYLDLFSEGNNYLDSVSYKKIRLL